MESIALREDRSNWMAVSWVFWPCCSGASADYGKLSAVGSLSGSVYAKGKDGWRKMSRGIVHTTVIPLIGSIDVKW
jgi:hypothetical protein